MSSQMLAMAADPSGEISAESLSLTISELKLSLPLVYTSNNLSKFWFNDWSPVAEKAALDGSTC